MSCAKLLDLSEDVLIYLFAFLSVPEILCIRQTCRLLSETTNQSIVWISAWETQIFRKGYPFPNLNIENMSRSELEQRTRHAYRLAQKWLHEYPNSTNYRDPTHTPLSSLLPHRDIYWVVSPSIPITDVRFIRSVRHPSSGAQSNIIMEESILVLSVSKGIWSVLTIWEVPLTLHGNDNAGPRKCTDWSPKGGIFTGLCLNHEDNAEADLAVSLVCEGRHEIDLFNISDAGELLQICIIPSVPLRANVSEEDTLHLQTMRPMKPMNLSGHVLAMSDDTASTVIYNWKSGAFAVLEHEEDEAGVWKHDHVILVVFAYKSILVVRARSLHLFPEPELCLAVPSSSDSSVGLPVYPPIASHTFGWVDGVSVVPIYPNPSDRSQPGILKLLVRLQSDNPWMANEHSLDLYELWLNPDFSATAEHAQANEADSPTLSAPSSTATPYSFPPTYTSRVTSTRGSLRCTDLLLGKCGTAIWVKPGERATHGLLTSDVYYAYFARTFGGIAGAESTAMDADVDGKAAETLVAGTFPGPLNPEDNVRTRKIYKNALNNWTALDYDEAIGRVVLGDAAGGVRILQL
ncbi:hypothetical protein BT96DRAFT_848152, partial [Gymnopus androsaceus JB14]